MERDRREPLAPRHAPAGRRAPARRAGADGQGGGELRVSIVSACYNEAESIPELIQELLAAAAPQYPAKAHRAAFQLILTNNINLTVHAGEAFGPVSIGQALHYCGAHRIGHGTRLYENPDLEQYVLDRRVPLEICITSNLQTHAVPSLASHPVRRYFDAGLNVTLSTDSWLMSGVTLTDEYWLAHRELGFTREEIEFSVGDFAATQALLEALGFRGTLTVAAILNFTVAAIAVRLCLYLICGADSGP